MLNRFCAKAYAEGAKHKVSMFLEVSFLKCVLQWQPYNKTSLDRLNLLIGLLVTYINPLITAS